jgi:Pectate lyase
MNSPTLFFFLLSALAPSTVAQSLTFTVIETAGLRTNPKDNLPAFPGAEGAGKWSKGGRGGTVIPVTNLHDSGPGSLRAAAEAKGPRTVVFRVSGTIELLRPISIKQPFLTIAGQSAPGHGICIKGHGVIISNTHDIIIRHLRCRPGDKSSMAGETDAFSMADVREVIIDHCSATWSTDECLSVTRDSDRVTVQNCLIAEALTSHALGSLIGSYEGSISFLNNLYACNRARNPRVSAYQSESGREQSAGPRVDFRQNVIFNWYSGPGYTGSGKPEHPERVAINYVNNYLKPGLDTLASQKLLAFTINQGAEVDCFMSGNHHEAIPSLAAQTDLLLVKDGAVLRLLKTPVPHEPVSQPTTAEQALAAVLTNAGATKPRRDPVDVRIVAGVRDGTGRQPTSLDDNAWPNLQRIEPGVDTDGDCLPDAWEQKHGLDPDDPSDAVRIANPEGWTHLELWLNQL